jgi:hypothetical protein
MTRRGNGESRALPVYYHIMSFMLYPVVSQCDREQLLAGTALSQQQSLGGVPKADIN